MPSFSRADNLSLPKVLAPSALRVRSDGKDSSDGKDGGRHIKLFGGSFTGFSPSAIFGAPEGLGAKRFTLPSIFDSLPPALSRTNSESSGASAATVAGPTPPSAWLVVDQESTPHPPPPPPPPPPPEVGGAPVEEEATAEAASPLPLNSSEAVKVAHVGAIAVEAEALKNKAGDVFGFLSPLTVGRDRGSAQAGPSAGSGPRNFQSAMAAFDDAIAEARSGAAVEPPWLAVAEKVLWGEGTAQGVPPPPPPPLSLRLLAAYSPPPSTFA